MNEDQMEIVAVLDQSGSMSGIADDTIGGFNGYIDNLKKEKQEGHITLIFFNTNYNVIWQRQPISQCKHIDNTMYRPQGGTALLDALGSAITLTGKWYDALNEKERPGVVSFFVCTDGAENSSREFTNQTVKQLLTQRQEENKWHFLFAGANIDAFSTGAKMGFMQQNIADIANDGQGQERFYKATIGQQMNMKRGRFTSFQEQYNQQVDGHDLKNLAQQATQFTQQIQLKKQKSRCKFTLLTLLIIGGTAAALYIYKK